MMNDQVCSICQRLALWRNGQNPYFIHEFEHSIFIVGDHQFHRGYSLLLLKDHVRDLHELEPAVQVGLFQELMKAGRSLVDAFHPTKMNYSCYGNLDPHIHWHLFPRYNSEADPTSHPWTHAAEFNKHLIDAERARHLAAQIKVS